MSKRPFTSDCGVWIHIHVGSVTSVRYPICEMTSVSEPDAGMRSDWPHLYSKVQQMWRDLKLKLDRDENEKAD